MITVTKPCHKLGYCPYGPLVEEFPLKKKRTGTSCEVFGHECPVYSMSEDAQDTRKETSAKIQIWNEQVQMPFGAFTIHRRKTED